MYVFLVFCFFKQKTAYDMRISDWSSYVCSSDLKRPDFLVAPIGERVDAQPGFLDFDIIHAGALGGLKALPPCQHAIVVSEHAYHRQRLAQIAASVAIAFRQVEIGILGRQMGRLRRSEEHTSELQSLMRISYAVFCLKKKN